MDTYELESINEAFPIGESVNANLYRSGRVVAVTIIKPWLKDKPTEHIPTIGEFATLGKLNISGDLVVLEFFEGEISVMARYTNHDKAVNEYNQLLRD